MINTWLPKEAGNIIMSKADWEVFSLVKVRERHKCEICNSKIKKGQFCIGAGEMKYCIECSHILFDNAINSMNGVIDKLKNQRDVIINNRVKFDKHNLGYGLGEEDDK